MREPIDFLRIKNDVYGNPRYVCHFLNFITDNDRECPDYARADRYQLALSRARKLGGRKFHNKQYGGGIVFQSYDLKGLENDIHALLNYIK